MSVLGWELAGADVAFLQPVSVLTLYEFPVPATRDRDTNVHPQKKDKY